MHEQFMLAALEQAWLGRGRCAPNPSVGAVAVSQGKIIAQSFHRGAGTLHAEQLLINSLPKACSNITLYVTLEPCNHWGKTPPCVEAIIDAKIATVVYGYADPNPVVASNKTPDILKAQGIEVIHYPLEAIDAFYRSYHHWLRTKTPWVTVKMAQSLDGKIAGKEGLRTTLSNDICHQFTHEKRLKSDLLLTTAKTINRDNPLMNVRLSSTNIAKPVAVIEGLEKMNKDATIFHTAKHLHIFKEVAFEKAPPHCSVHTISALNAELDLKAVVKTLGDLGMHDVFVEAGSRLFHALHKKKLVNTTYLYIAPLLLGDEAYPLYLDKTVLNHPAKITWQPMGDNVLATYEWTEESLCSQA